MKKYETPSINVERYALYNNIMDGDIDGDVDDNLWPELYTTAASPEGPDANILD